MNIPLIIFPLLFKLLGHEYQGLILIELLLRGSLLLRVLVLVGGGIFKTMHATQRSDPIPLRIKKAVAVELREKFFQCGTEIPFCVISIMVLESLIFFFAIKWKKSSFSDLEAFPLLCFEWLFEAFSLGWDTLSWWGVFWVKGEMVVFFDFLGS